MARPRKKRRTHVSNDANGGTAAGARPPKSMVIRMGAGGVGATGSQLAHDFRKMMEPDTASRLKERKGNKLKDYTAMAGPLGVTHLFLLSRSESGNYHLRIALTPRGPTLTFRVDKFTLSKDVAKAQKHPRAGARDHMTPPLLVMNNFSSPVAEGQAQDPILKQLESLTTTVFQSMFPAISPQSTPLSSIRRILLLNREPKLQSATNGTYILSLRHYAISTRSAGISRRVRRFDHTAHKIHDRKAGLLPNLGRLEDAADYLLDTASAGYTSASETELDTDAEVEVLETPAQRVLNKKKAQRDRQAGTNSSQANENIEKRSVKLSELGPRMRLRLIKVEEGICDGKVMWNEFVKKSKNEEAELEDKWEQRRKEKEERRALQRENVERKKKVKEAKKVDGTDNGKEYHEESDVEWESDEIEAELERDAAGDLHLDTDDYEDPIPDQEIDSGSEDSETGSYKSARSDFEMDPKERSDLPKSIAVGSSALPAAAVALGSKKRKHNSSDHSDISSDAEEDADQAHLEATTPARRSEHNLDMANNDSADQTFDQAPWKQQDKERQRCVKRRKIKKGRIYGRSAVREDLCDEEMVASDNSADYLSANSEPDTMQLYLDVIRNGRGKVEAGGEDASLGAIGSVDQEQLSSEEKWSDACEGDIGRNRARPE